MSDKKMLYLVLGVGVIGLVITMVLAKKLSDTSDKVDAVTGGLGNNPTFQAGLKAVTSLFK